MKIYAVALGLVLATACEQADQTPAPPARLPQQICDQARQALDKASQSAGFEYSGAEATVAEAGWRGLSDDQRGAIAQALGVNAACSAPEPARETTVLIRSETGRTLMERTVETSVDLSEILRQ